MDRRVKLFAVCAAVAAAGTACSSSSRPTASPTTSTTSATGISASTTTTTGGSRTESTTPAVTSPAGPQRCTPSQLKGSFTIVPGGASAGHEEAQLVLTNSGTVTCHLYGYVGMQLLDSSGSPLPTDVVRVPGTEAVVQLAPGQSASALAQFSPDVAGQGDSTTPPCQPVAKSTEVTPPDDTAFLVVAGPNSPVCGRGTVQIQPLEAAGSSGQ